MNLGFLDKALDGGKDLGALVDTLQQAAARTLEFDGEFPAQQVRPLPDNSTVTCAHVLMAARPHMTAAGWCSARRSVGHMGYDGQRLRDECA